MADSNLTKYKGRAFLAYIFDGSAFIKIGGTRSDSMTINNESVDVTTKDGDTWRELLPEAGIQSLDYSGSGVVSDDAGYLLLRTHYRANTFPTIRLVSSGGDMVEGLFQITSAEKAGDHNNEQNFSLSLASAGTPTFTDV